MVERKEKMRSLAEELVIVAHEMEKKGLVIGSVGNLSSRFDDEFMLISSRSSFLGTITTLEFVLVDFEGNKVEPSSLEPSSEWRMHAEIYRRRSDVNAVIHTHSPYASAYAFLKRKLRAVNPESQYVLGEIPIVPYFPSGTQEFATAVGAAIADGPLVAMLERHGTVAVGKRARDTLNLAEMLEETARINYLVDTLER
jgi:L-fuculose-phosphate aldolase